MASVELSGDGPDEDRALQPLCSHSDPDAADADAPCASSISDGEGTGWAGEIGSCPRQSAGPRRMHRGCDGARTRASPAVLLTNPDSFCGMLIPNGAWGWRR